MSRIRTFAISVASLLLLTTQQSAAAPCPPCATGGYDPDLRDRMIEIPGLGPQPCSFVETATGAYLEDNTEQCEGQQAFGVFCGCPIRSNACLGFCDNYERNTTVPNFLGLGDSYKPTCEQIHAYLQGAFDKGDADCTSLTEVYGEVCGCGSGSGGDSGGGSGGGNGNVFNNTDEPPLAGPDVNLDGQLYTAWTLCPDGSDTSYPDRDISTLWSNGANSSNPFVVKASRAVSGSVTCSGLDLITRSGLWPDDLGVESEERLILAGFCGCTPVSDACEFCPTNDMTMLNETFPLTEVVFDLIATCEQLGGLLSQYRKTDLRCWSSKTFAFLCGCNGGTPWYLGADTETEHATLAWVPRVSGFLSFLGSVYIIQDILKQQKSASFRGMTTYHMILLGMSIFDIASSIAWMVSTAALPSYDTERESESGVYGARGNDATCKTQGFFLELGFVGSTAFTACLTTFYVLNIIYGYREMKMKPLQKYFMAIPTTLAVALASAAIPYYRPFYVACFVSNPNSEVERDFDEWRYLVIFSILPVGISILVSVGNMFAIMRYVGKQQRIADKWRFGNAFRFSHPSNDVTGSTFPTSVHSRASTTSEVQDDEATGAQDLNQMGGDGVLPQQGAQGQAAAAGDVADNTEDSLTQKDGEEDQNLGSSQDGEEASNGNPASSAHPPLLHQASSRRTTFGGQTWSKTEAAVFWQAVSYVVAFLLTWVIYLIGQFKPYFSSDDESLYSFWIVLLLLNPLMGFWNAFVYIKPWTWQWRKQRAQAISARFTYRQSTKGSGAASSNSQLAAIMESEGQEEFEQEIRGNETDVVLEEGDEYSSTEERDEGDFTPVLSAVFEERTGDFSVDEEVVEKETENSEKETEDSAE